MLSIFDRMPIDAEPACKYCAYCIPGGYCTNPESPHFTEPMLADEGCSWISREVIER